MPNEDMYCPTPQSWMVEQRSDPSNLDSELVLLIKRIYGGGNISAYSKEKGKSFYKKKEKKGKRVNTKRNYGSCWQACLPELVWRTGWEMGINRVTIYHFYHPVLFGCSLANNFMHLFIISLLWYSCQSMTQEWGPSWTPVESFHTL